MQEKIDKLPGDYIAGFVDGEGCFYLMYRSETKLNRNNAPKYFRWIPYFAITLRADDIEILNMIKNTLSCGNVYLCKNGTVQYFIQNVDDLYNKAVPFFQTYPLRAKKRGDYALWQEALTIVYHKKINKLKYSQEDHKKLLDIRKKMRFIKSKQNRDYTNSPILDDVQPSLYD